MARMRISNVLQKAKLSIDILVPGPLVEKLSDIPEHGHDNEFTEIALLSGATLVLKKDPLANSTERILQVHVAGLDLQELLQFETAIRLLGRSFQRYTHLAYSPDNIYYIPDQDIDPDFNANESNDAPDANGNWNFAFESSQKEEKTFPTESSNTSEQSTRQNNLYLDNFMETSWAKLQQSASGDSPITGGADTPGSSQTTPNQRMRSRQCTVRILVSNMYAQALFRREHLSQLTIFKQMSNRYSADRMHITPITSTPSTLPRSQFCCLSESKQSMNWTRDSPDLNWPRVIQFLIELQKVAGITGDIARLLNGEMNNAPESLLRLILSERAIQCLTAQPDQLANLRSATACNIWISDDRLGDSDERVVIITGHYNKVGKAVHKIFSTIHSTMRLADIHKPIHNYTPVESVPQEDAALSGW
ncbi:hypothetical protein Unana1_08457 [Umbelopsis nana]